MASAFGHAFAAITIGNSFNKNLFNFKFWFIGVACSILPDADVIGFFWGVPYESFWGHRGFSHSFLFAAIAGVFFALIFYRNELKIKYRLALSVYFTLCTASHSILDAMTSGGLGVAFFSPWDNQRFFFPWRPIKVSPIGVESFFSEWGYNVIMSELVWVGLPGIVLLGAIWGVKKYALKSGKM
ncbi:MAG: metal-dependent hydrolase [Cyclobacteriaceae bacterium]|nr:metal-dependent hydrolase [Cyclobacteriaceae bacterium]